MKECGSSSWGTYQSGVEHWEEQRDGRTVETVHLHAEQRHREARRRRRQQVDLETHPTTRL